MTRKILQLFIISLFSMVILPYRAVAADTYAGIYTGAQLSLDVVAGGAGYTGTIRLGEKSFPLKAQSTGGKLVGTFTSDGTDFDFSATLVGNNLTLTTGTSTYRLSRKSGNPLDTAAPSNPLSPGGLSATTAPSAPDGYSVAASTSAGKAWVTDKPSSTTIAGALGSTIADLSTFFGSKPAVAGAFEDTKDHLSGGASFTATFAGQPVKGLILCKLVNKVAKISVIFAAANATPDDWGKLSAAAASATIPAPTVKLTTYQFPDGTGSIGLADGWKVQSASLVDPLVIKGPADQSIYGGFSIGVQTPDSTLVTQQKQTQAQSDAMWRRLNRQPPAPPPSPFVIAPLTDPDEALPVVIPQFNAICARVHQPQIFTIDKIISKKAAAAPSLPNGKAQVLEYTLTRTVDDAPRHYKAKAQWESDATNSPGGPQGGWMLFMARCLEAPDATYDQDIITMGAMVQSIQINGPVFMKVQEDKFEAFMAANNAAFKARMQANDDQFKAGVAARQQQYQDQLKGYDEHNKQWAIDENQKARNADNWIEYAGGYRTVIDTQTGQSTKVDLGNVNGIVNSLNESANDPHRFVQIPLRDEKDPTNQR